MNKELLENGYTIIKNFYDNEKIDNILKSIDKISDKETYYDNNNIIMRCENFYDKDELLMQCNEDFLKLLKDLCNKKMIIFKDKYNLKPPNGEGFFCHYDGIYKFKCNGIEYDGWYKYAPEFWNIALAIDDCNKNNGTIQVSKMHDLSFSELYENTVKNGTPEIKKKKRN